MNSGHGLILYKTEVRSVLSADDMNALVSLGVDGLCKLTRIRLAGVDAPDAYKAVTGDPAIALRNEIGDMVLNKTCYVSVQSVGKGGWIVTLYVEDQGGLRNINELLIGRGYAFNEKGREK